MEIKVLKNQQNHLEFVLKGERHTLPNILKDRLSRDSNVIFAAYKLHHPLDNEAIFIVKTQGKTAKKALNDACKSIVSELTEFQKSSKKVLK